MYDLFPHFHLPAFRIKGAISGYEMGSPDQPAVRVGPAPTDLNTGANQPAQRVGPSGLYSGPNQPAQQVNPNRRGGLGGGGII